MDTNINISGNSYIKFNFDDVDLNKDGTITKEEYQTYLDKKESDSMDLISNTGELLKNLTQKDLWNLKSSFKFDFTQIKNVKKDVVFTDETKEKNVFNKEVNPEGIVKQNIRTSAQNLLTLPEVRTQVKGFVKEFLESKNIPFEGLQNVFENIYSETLNSVVSDSKNFKFDVDNLHWGGRGQTAEASYNPTNLIGKFISQFCTKLSDVIKGIQKSDSNIDCYYMDYNAIATDENGSVDEKLLKTLKNGDSIELETPLYTLEARNAFLEKVQLMIDKMRNQLIVKAKASAKRQGCEFDIAAFDTAFNSAKTSMTTIKSISARGLTNAVNTKLVSENSYNPRNIITAFLQEFNKSYSKLI